MSFQVAKMNRRSKSCPPDPLQVTHQVFSSKLEAYRDVRPPFKYISMRTKRLVFLKDDQHQSVINQVYGHIYENSKAAKLTRGLEVLNHVRLALIDHGKKVKAGKSTAGEIKHHLKKVKKCVDMHPDSLYKRKCGHQKYLLQVLVAEYEAQALIYYLEKTQKDAETIDEMIPSSHELYKLHSLAERYFNDLRMIKCA